MDVFEKNKTIIDEVAVVTITVLFGVYLFTHSFALAVLAILVLVIIALVYWKRQLIIPLVTNKLQKEESEDEDESEIIIVTTTEPSLSVSSSANTISLGRCIKTDKPVKQPLPHLGNLLVAGMTRYGKTSLLHGMVCHLLQTNDPNSLKLAFSDGKRVSFNVFKNIDHLFAPIATEKESTLELLLLLKSEMERRFDLFSGVTDDMCTNLQEYEQATGKKLPVVVSFFDELADTVDVDSEAEKIMTSIAKMGLATGLHLVISTQRLTKKGISHEVQSQCATILSSYMKSSDDYRIAKVPSTVYANMKPVKGTFAMFSPETAPAFTEIYGLGGWGYITGNYMENSEIVKVAKKYSTSKNTNTWADLSITVPVWGGTADDKVKAISQLDKQLSTDVKTSDLVKHFDISAHTARIWIKKYVP